MDKKGQKRKDYLSWDEYFMGVAMLSGMRSKDPHSQVGACIAVSYTHLDVYKRQFQDRRSSKSFQA